MDFEYSPLNLERPSLRLLRLHAGDGVQPIECQLVQAFFDGEHVPDYEAVSYTWGRDEFFEITLDGSRFPVRSNLWALLHDIRYRNEDRILWIDAICINQDSHSERGHQVRQMAQIYQRAFRVIIWLGPLFGDATEYLIHAAAGLHKHISGVDWPPDDTRWYIFRNQLHLFEYDQHRLREAFHSILERPWFYRVWIIQEVANARATLVHCGYRSIPGRTFAILPVILDIALSAHQQAIFDVMPGPSREHSWWSKQRDLYTVLQKFINTHASRDHDRIFALLGLCNTEEMEMIPIDYARPIQDIINDTLSVICLPGTRIDPSLRPNDIDSFVQILPFVHPLGFSEWCPQIRNDFIGLLDRSHFRTRERNLTYKGDPLTMVRKSRQHGENP